MEYDKPLDSASLASSQPDERARILARLETMWAGLQADIENAREYSERGVDPRMQQLQLQVVKLQAQILRLLATPMPEPAGEPDPDVERSDAQAEAMAVLERVRARMANG